MKQILYNEGKAEIYFSTSNLSLITVLHILKRKEIGNCLSFKIKCKMPISESFARRIINVKGANEYLDAELFVL